MAAVWRYYNNGYIDENGGKSFKLAQTSIEELELKYPDNTKKLIYDELRNAQGLSDQEISWLLLDSEFSIAAAYAIWRGSIDWVKEAKALAVGGGETSDNESFQQESRIESFGIMFNPETARLVPSADAFDQNDWVLAAFHPQSEWFVGHGPGVGFDGVQNFRAYNMFKDLRIFDLLEIIILSGVLDNKPAVFAGVSNNNDDRETLRVLTQSSDDYLREAAERALRMMPEEEKVIRGEEKGYVDTQRLGIGGLKKIKNSYEGTTLTTASSPTSNPGGIDFNPDYMDIQRQGTGMNVSPPSNIQELQNIEIDGLAPFIFNITPITNIRMILGKSEDQSDEFSLSQLN